MYVFSIAARHMKTRSISWVAIAMISLVVVMYLLVISVVEGFKANYMDKLQSILAHATVSVGQLTGGIEKPEEWAAELQKSVPGIKGVTIGLETPAMAIFNSPHGGGTIQTIGTLRGVDMDKELQFGRLKEIIFPSDLKELGRHEYGGHMRPDCILGGYWRKAYGLSVGDHVTFIFTKEDGDPKPLEFVITGFFSGESSYLETGAYVDRKMLADVIGVEGRAKTLSVWLDDPNRPDLGDVCKKLHVKTAELIKRDVPEAQNRLSWIEIETWQDKDNKFYQAMTRENTMMRFILLIFLALVALIVFLIFGRLVAEKVRDVGALRAMGATPSGIISCFLVQGFFIGMTGLLVGLALSCFVVGDINGIADFLKTWFGIDPYPSDQFGVEKIPHVTLAFDVVVISILSVGAAVLGAIYPAYRASQLNPVECLRHE
jgi:lipoprotein-releasing system permease protein